MTHMTSDVPRYIVDLDLPEEERWTEILSIYHEHFEPVLQDMHEIMEALFGSLGKVVEALTSAVLSGITRTGFVYYGKELKAISKASGMSLGRTVMLQLAYEMAAACTSIITWDPELQQMILARTMDWDLAALKRLTIEVDFQRNGNTVFIATTWAGYVGILTGLRPNYSVAVNFRSVGESPAKNLRQGVLRAWPVGFLVREVLETEQHFSDAVDAFATSDLMAPVYLSVAGVKKGEGVVITRNRQTEDLPRQILGESGYILQCNIDHWLSDSECTSDILWSLQRRRVVAREMQRLHGNTTCDAMWHLFTISPVKNEENIYGCIMVAGNSSLVTKIM